MYKIGQSGGSSGRLLGPLLKTGFPLMKNPYKPLAKSVLISLGLTAAASATGAAIQNEIFASGMTILIISKKEMNDIMKINKSLEESSLLIKSLSETVKNEAKEQKGEFLGTLLGTLGTTLVGNLLTGKGRIKTNEGTIRAD